MNSKGCQFLNDLIKIIPAKDDVQISVGNSQVLFQTGKVQFFSRLLDGSYPDTSKIIPTSFGAELEVSAKAFSEAIDRAYLLAREEKTNIVRMEATEDGAVRIESASDGVGKVIEHMEATNFIGDPVRIAFNSKYMLEALKATDSEQIKIEFSGPMRPIIIRPSNGSLVNLNLILPYRTNV